MVRDVAPIRAPVPTRPRAPSAPPAVSVLVPAYNAAATIGDAIESALTQSPSPHEVIVSDDGSEDDLEAALRSFHPHLRVVRGPNEGLAAARNRAASVASGGLLALLDADDVWLPGRVAALRAAASARPDLAVLTTDATIVRDGVPERQTYYGTRQFPVHDQVLAILEHNFIFGAGAIRTDVFRRIGGYSPGLRYAEDWDLWIRLLLQGHRAGLIDVPLYEYRRRDESLTAQRAEVAFAVLAMLERTRPLLAEVWQSEQLDLTTQAWTERAARACLAAADPRSRRVALRAAVGRRASARARARFGLAAIAPSMARMRPAGEP